MPDPVANHLKSLDGVTAADAVTLTEIMQRISGHQPAMWNQGTLGFDVYHYQYSTGRQGDSFVVGFYPRNSKTTIYIMDGTARYAELLTKLGKHTTTGYCLYIKRLSDIKLPVLEQILRQSYDNIKDQSKNGPVDRILWKAK